MTADIVVIGSINMDLVVKTERAPLAGETLPGETFLTVPGGKGANQAAAAGRLGSKVAMVGRVGNDAFGNQLTANLADFGVDVSLVRTDASQPTGTALIVVEASGENRILVVAGANGMVSLGDIDNARDVIAGARLVVLQMEIPIPTIEYILTVADELNVPALLNLAPANELPDHAIRKIHYLAVNEIEAGFLSGIKVNDQATAIQAGKKLREMGAAVVILTLGRQGGILFDAADVLFEPGITVKAIDTTGAGDAFIGGFAHAIVSGLDHRQALRFANITGGLAVTKMGAQSALPYYEDVEKLLE